MTTQLEAAKKGKITPEVKAVAKKEGIPAKKLTKLVASGKTVIVKNIRRKIDPIGIGSGLRVKVNVNIGTSQGFVCLRDEVEKAKLSSRYGADAIMDLSTAGNIKEIRSSIMRATPLPLGTVPIYELCAKLRGKKKSLFDFSGEDLLKVIESQLKQGVDFITVHCGIRKKTIDRYNSRARLAGIVSRGGSILTRWIQLHGEENPLNKDYDYLLELACEYDAVLSLGDGLRPGSLYDATDYFQLAELRELGKLVKIARAKNVQTMVEGPGHIPINQIARNVRLEKQYCHGAPFYVLGPLVTDIAAGYDHINAAIGGALAALHGADFLCYLTQAEHLALPTKEEVVDGLIATRIAAHAVNLTRFKSDAAYDHELSKARSEFNWGKVFKLSMNTEKALAIHSKRKPKRPTKDVCSMCGEFCPIKISKGKK